MFKCWILGKFEILAQHPFASVEKHPNERLKDLRGICVRKKNSGADCTGGHTRQG